MKALEATGFLDDNGVLKLDNFLKDEAEDIYFTTGGKPIGNYSRFRYFT